MIDLNPFLQAAETLMVQDEAERALLVLNNLPGYFRAHEPEAVRKLRMEIESKIFQTCDYQIIDDDLPKTDEQAMAWVDGTMRGHVMNLKLHEANQSGIEPFIVDMGPGDYQLPIGLQAKGHKFKYKPVGVEQRAMEIAKERLKDKIALQEKSPLWFVAYEIIEHMPQPRELAQTAARYGIPDKVFLSTPRYTYANGKPEWREKGQPHLRTYTPNEFAFVAQDLFKGYTWSYYDNEVMVLVGELRK